MSETDARLLRLPRCYKWKDARGNSRRFDSRPGRRKAKGRDSLRLPERFCSERSYPPGGSSLSRRDKEKQLKVLNEANYP
ncbi:hypothetical protein NQZ68_021639 [Dissostichus eleginoides]|nr:hypothetical protein NQZ68_021639 [Dissostichus eleginoides]